MAAAAPAGCRLGVGSGALIRIPPPGHTAVHETGIHGGPPTRLVGAVTAVAFVFGSIVLLAEALG